MHTKSKNESLPYFLVADPLPSFLLSEAEEQDLARGRQGSDSRIWHTVIEQVPTFITPLEQGILPCQILTA